MSDWKVLESCNLFDSPILQLHRERLERPGEQEANWLVVEISSGAAVLPVHKNGDVVMISQYRPALGKRLWEMPAGRIEKGESPRQAAQRELQEEAGFAADDLQALQPVTPLAGICRHVVHILVARGLTPCETRHEPNEDIIIRRFPIDTVQEMVRTGEINCGIALGALAQYLCLVDHAE